MEEARKGITWEDLHVEIRDSILHFVVTFEKDSTRGLSMEAVLCFVCREWHQRKPFWRANSPRRGLAPLPPAGKGLTAKAASLGNIPLLKWLRENGCQWDQRCCAAAAGQLELLKWLREQRCRWDQSTCIMAAENGNLEVLKWASQNGCLCTCRTTAGAAKGGHLEVLKWLRENGCDWSESTCCLAAEHGHFEVLKWAIENGCKHSAKTWSSAVKRGDLAMLGWLKEKGCPSYATSVIEAAESDRKDVLMWLDENGYSWNRTAWASITAAKKGNFELLKWLRANHWIFNVTTCYSAAEGGNLEMLKWAIANGYEWEKDQMCRKAAASGNLDMLKWVVQIGCPLESEVCTIAAEKGNLEMLKWAVANGCSFQHPAVISRAVLKGHPHVLQWVGPDKRPDRFPPEIRTFNSATAMNENCLVVMKWLKENGYPWGTATCRTAAEHGNLEALKWLREQGCPWDQTTSTAALNNRQFPVLMWAMENGCQLDESYCASIAATWDHFALLKRLCALGCSMDSETICLQAACNGNLEMLKWAVGNGSPLRLDILLDAASNRAWHLQVVDGEWKSQPTVRAHPGSENHPVGRRKWCLGIICCLLWIFLLLQFNTVFLHEAMLSFWLECTM